ncbi:MAG: hypothetical protein RR350_06600, partial [Oscillibacter sp.]
MSMKTVLFNSNLLFSRVITVIFDKIAKIIASAWAKYLENTPGLCRLLFAIQMWTGGAAIGLRLSASLWGMRLRGVCQAGAFLFQLQQIPVQKRGIPNAFRYRETGLILSNTAPRCGFAPF